MKSLILSFFAVLLLTFSCDRGLNDVDDTYVPILQNLPDIDLSKRDLSVKNVYGEKSEKKSENNVELSTGACFGKTLRNIAIRFSINAEYVLSFFKELEAKCSDFKIDRTSYFLLKNYGLPFYGGDAGLIIPVRVKKEDGIIKIDMITWFPYTEERDLQIYIDDYGDSDDETFKIDFVAHSQNDENPLFFDTVAINVDIPYKDFFKASFKYYAQYGNHCTKYSGNFLIDNTKPDQAFNISDMIKMEDFAMMGGGFFKGSSWSKFNTEVGSTKFTFAHGGPFEPVTVQSWNVSQNTIIPNEDSPFFNDADIAEIHDIENNFNTHFLEKSGDTIWKSEIPDDAEFITIDLNNIKLRNPNKPFIMPEYIPWDKYEDVSGCFDGLEDALSRVD